MESEIYFKMRDVEDKHWWFAGRRRIIRSVLSLLDLPENPHILEAGCSTGGNLQLLSEFGAVIGMEPNELAVEIATARKIGKILKGNLPDDLPFSTQKFDLIVLLDVLEHIEKELSTLKILNSLLVPNGYLVLTVPAFPFLWSQHDHQHHHKRRYRAAALKDSIQEAGYSLYHLTYYNTWLFPIVASIRLLRKILPTDKIGADLQLPNPLLNKILQAIFSSERHLISWARLPFGVSLLAVAQKR